MTPSDKDIPYTQPPSRVSRAGFNEDDLVKTATMRLMGELGWSEQDDLMHEWREGTSSEGRRSMKEVILHRRLEAALRDLNPDMPEEGIRKALDEITLDRRAMPKVDANKALHGLLKQGVPVEVQVEGGRRETRTVRVIDWETPTANHFFAATEFWVKDFVS